MEDLDWPLEMLLRTRPGRREDDHTESSDVLSVLDELYTDTLSNSGVGLLGLDTNLLEHDTLSVGRTTEGRGLEGGSKSSLLVGKVGPFLVLAVSPQLSGGVETTRHVCWSEEKKSHG